MSDITIELTPLTFMQRLMQAGCEIVGLHTALPLELCHHILDKCMRRASPEFGVVPYQIDELTASDKLALVLRTIEFVGEDLAGRGISAAAVQHVQNDLATFYRGVRGIPPISDS